MRNRLYYLTTYTHKTDILDYIRYRYMHLNLFNKKRNNRTTDFN